MADRVGFLRRLFGALRETPEVGSSRALTPAAGQQIAAPLNEAPWVPSDLANPTRRNFLALAPRAAGALARLRRGPASMFEGNLEDAREALDPFITREVGSYLRGLNHAMQNSWEMADNINYGPLSPAQERVAGAVPVSMRRALFGGTPPEADFPALSRLLRVPEEQLRGMARANLLEGPDVAAHAIEEMHSPFMGGSTSLVPGHRHFITDLSNRWELPREHVQTALERHFDRGLDDLFSPLMNHAEWQDPEYLAMVMRDSGADSAFDPRIYAWSDQTGAPSSQLRDLYRRYAPDIYGGIQDTMDETANILRRPPE